ncbi:MAG: chemotaxis protein [Candidatus Magnetobacterium sp. LHC-1]|uniref:Chemotaxis protein CheV n=1 Tax=Candidatus Magnetobacterium casense TaxID=1455061 RepID=A0ABS6RXV6_9BACT|nr:chemotaxis protein [Candidatus Magnetobacterium casensis]MBF0609032.1 chemotaxis protein CheV [Nitrospirota bacterium]MBV6341411.1 chemotaxis protein CheV [Candidatus Magnetobacterium casensis]
MSDLIEEVQRQTNLSLGNQMEMLTFHLSDRQLYAINVFKIVEVFECPKKITKMPNSHYAVKGSINFRGKSIIVIDLSEVLGLEPVDYKNTISYVIVCEYSTTTQGFLVSEPDTLINKSWEDIKAPSGIMANSTYLTALAFLADNTTVQILDIEKILTEIIGADEQISEEVTKQKMDIDFKQFHIMIVEDSKTARAMMQSVLEQLGVTYTFMENAVNALTMLEELAVEHTPLSEKFFMIISDIEMPGMDGFTFTKRIKENPKLSDLYVVLHSSLSDSSTVLKTKKYGADDFISKFNPDSIAKTILNRISGTA